MFHRFSSRQLPEQDKQRGDKVDGVSHCPADSRYRERPNALSLGPELPLTRQNYRAKELFPAFADRLPDKENPAYPEYLESLQVPLTETDPLVLLPTIGRVGPSSFIFDPEFKETEQRLKSFREGLALTTRDFSALFDISIGSLHKLESGKASGREVSKRMALYMALPQAALFEVQKNISKVHRSVGERVVNQLSASAPG